MKQSNMLCAESTPGRTETSHKLRTCHANWYCVFLERFALFQPHSLWCFLPCWVVTNNRRTEPYLRLEKHADDSHHRKSSVGDFSIELLGFLSWVRSGQHLESKVSSIRISSGGLFLGDFAESHVGQDLTPSSRVGMGWHVGPLNSTQNTKATCYNVYVIIN